MKKYFLFFAAALMLSMFSCRETPANEAGDAIEEAADDAGDAIEDAGEDLEEAAEEAGGGDQ